MPKLCMNIQWSWGKNPTSNREIRQHMHAKNDQKANLFWPHLCDMHELHTYLAF